MTFDVEFQEQDQSFRADFESLFTIVGPPGPAGVSPTVDVTRQGTDTLLTITDAQGRKTAVIHDGEQGAPGKDGVGIGRVGTGVNAEAFNAPENVATGAYSHAEGYRTNAGDGAYAGGAHAEGYECSASNRGAHAQGKGTVASGYASHAQGQETEASSTCAHAEGFRTRASGYASHAQGQGTIAAKPWQHAQGKYNLEDTTPGNGKYAHIVGNGTDDTHRSNAHTVDWDGNGWFAGDVQAMSKRLGPVSMVEMAARLEHITMPQMTVRNLETLSEPLQENCLYLFTDQNQTVNLYRSGSGDEVIYGNVMFILCGEASDGRIPYMYWAPSVGKYGCYSFLKNAPDENKPYIAAVDIRYATIKF